MTASYSLHIMSLQTLSDIMCLISFKQLEKTNRPEKVGDFSVAFPAPPAPFRAAHFGIRALRRAVAGRTARLHQRFAKFSWRLASMLVPEIGSNFFIKAAPFEKLRFLPRNLKAVFQATSHLLPREQAVRADFLQEASLLF